MIRHPVVLCQSVVHVYSAIFLVNPFQLGMTLNARENNLDALPNHESILFLFAGQKDTVAEMHSRIPLDFICFGLSGRDLT